MSIDLDRAKKAFDDLVESSLPGVDFGALYTCQVVSQNSDGTLDLQPKDPKIPSQSHIPFRAGIPGIEITVQSGAQVLLGWENGDPSVPFCALWLTGVAGDLQTLAILAAGTIQVGANATLAAARETDPVEPNELMTAWMNAVVTGLAGNTGAPITIPPAPVQIGTIESGSLKVTIA